MVERGKPNRIIDGIGWTLGVPSKLILWDRRVENHHVSHATEAAVIEYLAENKMADAKVRINQYAPIQEWKRLYRNDRVGLGWRATFGTISLIGYTLIPGRLIGGDAYNPYTHSLYLYSDVPAIALHEGGHGKDFARRRWPGTYAAVSLLPLASLYTEGRATRDALGYLASRRQYEDLAQACEILYPAYGTYVGSEFGGLFWTEGGPLLSIAGAIPGHIAGRSAARHIRALAAELHEQHLSHNPTSIQNDSTQPLPPELGSSIALGTTPPSPGTRP